MSLTLVSTPIGHPKDISLRALEFLKAADVIVGEEERELQKFLKINSIEAKRTELLNEHSDQKQVENLTKLCKELKVALISDCGTPAFCDPGADLVQRCHQQKISVTAIPGASSVMMALSLCGFEIKQFVFAGFPPQKSEERQIFLKELSRENRTTVLMDTPYRLSKLVGELSDLMPERQAFLGCDLTQRSEKLFLARLQDLQTQVNELKAEFILILSPNRRA